MTHGSLASGPHGGSAGFLPGSRGCCLLGWLRAAALALLFALLPTTVYAQIQAAHRPIAAIDIVGLREVGEQLVRNQIRSQVGQPYDPRVVEQDIVRITHLGRFSSVTARITPHEDHSLTLIFDVQEQPSLSEVQVVGNKKLDDLELIDAALLRPGDPVDPFLIDRGAANIRRAYEDEGYFLSEISHDKETLASSRVLIYRVREGPRVRIRGIRFEGNESFTADQLDGQVRSDTYFWPFKKGAMSRERLDADAARVRDYYRDRGYLDAEVGRRIELSDNHRDAVVVFVVREGARYTVAEIRVEGNEAFPDAEILQMIPMKIGSRYTSREREASEAALRDLYGKLGYIDTQVRISRLFHQGEPKVDVLVDLREGRPYWVGNVTVRGNHITKQKVILQQARGLDPGRRFDRTGMENTERLLQESPLFSDGRVTVLGEPDDTYRDVLIEVKEQNTGSLSFGVGVNSDAGVLGAIELTQRNFDIADTPENVSEFITGKAFRGAGQFFSISLQPGSQQQLYQVSFREPALLDSNIFFDSRMYYYTRLRQDWDEGRAGMGLGFGHRFGDVWQASIKPRFEAIEIDNIASDAPIDAFDVEGDSFLTGLGFSVVRNTTNSRIFPTEGNVIELGIERVGAMGGDYDFTQVTAEFRQFWTVDEDFFGRKTVLSLRAEVGYILEDNEAPIFERYYAGGHRSFRGFRFRGVGPRGIQADTGMIGDDPVGGDWKFLLGLEYNYPIIEETLRGVFFIDTGTVQEDVAFDKYRVAVGAGIRLKIPFLGQAPFALDLGIPIIKEPGDETRLISFDLAVPF